MMYRGMGMRGGMGMGGMGMHGGMGANMAMQAHAAQTPYEGTLAINVISAHDLEHDYMRKIDPYVKVSTSYHDEKTQPCHDGGKNPTWNQTLHIQVKNGDMLKFEVKDHDAMHDDLLGEASLSPQQYSMGYQGQLQLMTKHGHNGGSLQVAVHRG